MNFDDSFFAKKNFKSVEDKFKYIYETNFWKAETSNSGKGSELTQTKQLIDHLPKLFKEYDIHSILDIPCGDFNWIQNLDLSEISYHGADIVPQIIEQNKHQFPNYYFSKIDLLTDSIPRMDLVLCRDCLVHFSFSDIHKSLKNILKSKSKYLLITTFSECAENKDITTGDWRILNFQNPPFSFPPPLLLVNEKCTEGNNTYTDKCLGLWDLDIIKKILK